MRSGRRHLAAVRCRLRSVADGDLPALAVIGGWFAITTRWSGWAAGIRLVQGNDVASYLQMSSAAPGLPTTSIGSAYSARFVLHWLVGSLSWATGVTLPVTYRICWIGAVLGLLVAVRAVLRAVGLRGWPRWLLLGLTMLNPYLLRFSATAPGYLADPVFEFGLAVALLGVLRRRPWGALAGVLVGSIARQTMLVAAPVLALWLLLAVRHRPAATGTAARAPSRLACSAAAVLAVLLPVLESLLVARLTAPFTHRFTPSFPADSALPLLLGLPATAGPLATHVLRVLAPLLLCLGLAVGVLSAAPWGRLRRLLHGPDPREGHRLDLLMALVVAASVIGQPLAMGSTFAGFTGNEPRLSAIGLVPLVVWLALVLVRDEPSWTPWRVAGLVVVVLLASLHHIYTVVGPSTPSEFLGLQAGCAVLGGVLLCHRPAIPVRRGRARVPG